jgi:uncharacterized membrane protein
VSHAHNPCSIPQSPIQSLSKANGDVFGYVVCVHVQVAVSNDLEIKQSVMRKQLEKVIQKADSRADVTASRAVKTETQVNLSFPGKPINRG